MATHLDAGIQVVILARGPSIKLEALTEDTPKPLLPVANRQLLSYQINELHNIGVNSLFFWEPSLISTTDTHNSETNLWMNHRMYRLYDCVHEGRHFSDPAFHCGLH